MINFVYKWDKGMKENSWSGIPYSIQKNLKNKTQVNECDLKWNFNFFDKVSRNLLSKVGYTKFNYEKEIKGTKEINKMLFKENEPIITFLEYNSKYVKDTYVYQDLSVDYCVRLWNEGSNLKNYSPLTKKMTKSMRKRRLNDTLKFYRNCKGIFTMSEWLAKDLVEKTGVDKNKVHHVGGGSNIDISKLDESHKKGNKFLFVGKDYKRKNGPLVVSAFKILKKEYPNSELYIAGPEKQPEETKNVDGITFLGRLNYDQLLDYYNKCDYYVMPSKFEAYGLVFVEALIFGLPCIVNNVHEMPKIIDDGKNGYVLLEENAESLYKLMKKMLENKNELVEFVKTNREKYIENYSWNKVTERMIEVMRKDGYDI